MHAVCSVEQILIINAGSKPFLLLATCLCKQKHTPNNDTARGHPVTFSVRWKKELYALQYIETTRKPFCSYNSEGLPHLHSNLLTVIPDSSLMASNREPSKPKIYTRLASTYNNLITSKCSQMRTTAHSTFWSSKANKTAPQRS